MIANFQPQRDALSDQMHAIVRLIDATHPQGPVPAGTVDVSREMRGLAIVLLFAAYESLLTSATRTLLEAAISLRVGNRRLKPGFRMFALEASVRSARDVSDSRLFSRALPRLVSVAAKSDRTSTINPDVFPADGSFMRDSQVELWCDLFDIGRPAAILTRTWNDLNGVVADRNAIAHGRLTPEVVGRRYTETELRDLVENWSADWRDFLNHVEGLASSRSFFRLP